MKLSAILMVAALGILVLVATAAVHRQDHWLLEQAEAQASAQAAVIRELSTQLAITRKALAAQPPERVVTVTKVRPCVEDVGHAVPVFAPE